MLDISVRNPHTLDKFTSFEVAVQVSIELELGE